ncbi:MAG: NAD-dependent epimerase/dehydratase family protein [Thermocrispum sp.]
MRVFVAGGTGVIGRRLVPRLVARGHQVTATTSAGKLGLLEQLGAEGVVMDGNPDKLGHPGPLADAWAVAGEVKATRRRDI